ncbi:MAG TPA: ABC transporter permease [Thermoplasmata archaeon]|nr:ABC transporter permease [Thermoplasmata archaeon]
MTVADQVRASLRICYFNGLLPLGRSPMLVIAVFLTPFSFLFFLFIIGQSVHSNLFQFGIVGGILFTALFTGNGMLNDCAYLRLERQLQQVFVASPVTSVAYVLGMALSELAFCLPALVLFFAILGLVHPVGAAAFATLVAIVLLTWLLASTLGFLISTLFRQLREIWPIGNVVFSSLAILPPLFYPIAALPGNYRWVAFLAPSTFAGQLADWSVGLGGTPITPPWLGSPVVELAGLVGATVLFALAATFLARWREH